MDIRLDLIIIQENLSVHRRLLCDQELSNHINIKYYQVITLPGKHLPTIDLFVVYEPIPPLSRVSFSFRHKNILVNIKYTYFGYQYQNYITSTNTVFIRGL